jgi:hypothetical protein
MRDSRKGGFGARRTVRPYQTIAWNVRVRSATNSAGIFPPFIAEDHTLVREDEGHTYLGGVRLSGAERSEVSWQAAHQAIKEECSGVSEENSLDHQ